ncbi:hypothetical protein MHBO_000355 [Bonamia ostreae]|uniref:Uncharacterized protein n=1 Tax=Bonamia ostreae TaxID=126728 RepID=A0ABV2AFZ5_9EUKA
MESPIREIDVDNGSLKILQYSNFVKYLFADKRDSLFQTYLTILENCPLMPRKYDVFMEEVCAYIEFPMEDYKRIESEEKPGLGMRAIRTFLFFLKILRTRGFSIAAKMDSQDMLCDANGNIVFFTVQLCKLSENNPGTDTNPIVATLENLKEKLSIIPEELDNSLALAKKSGSVNFEILLKSLSGPNEIHDQNNVWLLRMEGENLMVMKDDEVVKCQIEFQLRNEAEIVICIGGELESLLVRKKCSAGKEYVHKEKQEDKNFIYYVLRSFFPSEKFTVGQVERIRLWEMELDTVYKKCRDPEQYRVEEKMTSKLQHSNFHTPKTYTVIEDSNDSLTYVFNENNENEILHECLKNFMNVCPFVPSAHGQFPTLSTKMEEKTDWGRASDENNKSFVLNFSSTSQSSHHFCIASDRK